MVMRRVQYGDIAIPQCLQNCIFSIRIIHFPQSLRLKLNPFPSIKSMLLEPSSFNSFKKRRKGVRVSSSDSIDGFIR
jgi:hypothetical protein